MAGCKPAGFDIQAVCPEGSYAEPFIPLGHWMTSAAAPYILVFNFGILLALWTLACVGLFIAWQIFRARSKKARIEEAFQSNHMDA